MDNATARLRELVRAPEAELDLAEAALVIAACDYPALAVTDYLRRLDALADAVRTRVAPGAPPLQRIEALNDYLFAELGFAGNRGDFYDPRNSFLNEVLDRRLGIPITLSLVYVEVGRRLGLDLVGVSFPGHFLVKLAGAGPERVLDPFAGGATVGEPELWQRLTELYGEERLPGVPLAKLLAPAGKRETLVRMLRNLKGIYHQGGRWDKALATVDKILIVQPGLAEERRDRGEIYCHLECFHAAIGDFKRYLELAPQAPDQAAVRTRLTDLLRSAGRLH